jgi:hypothetical protein
MIGIDNPLAFLAFPELVFGSATTRISSLEDTPLLIINPLPIANSCAFSRSILQPSNSQIKAPVKQTDLPS